jgi:hypothetical protein
MGYGCAPSSAKIDQASPWHIIALRTTITRRKSIGESGSPKQKPLTWQIFSPGVPFSSTLVLAVERMADNQFNQMLGNPMNHMISMRNGQATESKALAMSTLRSREGIRQAWSDLAEAYMSLKFSWMHLPFMMALWHGCTILSSFGARWFAMILEKSFPITWITEIGW